jgi:nucleoside-diphosphate-sugar epimerase
MKVLLTGANGFLGKNLRQGLLEHDITTLGRSNSDVNVDLSTTEPAFNRKFDLVIHAAGQAHLVPKVTREINHFYNVNFTGTLNLLNGLEQSGIPRYFVFISSVSVYGLEAGSDINEETPLSASDPYGKSKIEAENYIKDWCSRNDIIFTILRLPLIAGPNPPGNLGSMIKGLRNGFYFNIDGGKSKKSIVLASDVARFLIPVAKVGGIYNLTDGVHPSFKELSELIALQIGKTKVLNIPIFVAIVMAKLGDIIGRKAPINSNKLKKITSTLTFSDTKARSSFGWSPTPVLEGFKLV